MHLQLWVVFMSFPITIGFVVILIISGTRYKIGWKVTGTRDVSYL